MQFVTKQTAKLHAFLNQFLYKDGITVGLHDYNLTLPCIFMRFELVCYMYLGIQTINTFIFLTAPAIVEPGENTTTEVPEDGFRFFQTECAAFAVTVVIEQIDIKGRCHLYASNTVANPGPLDNSTSVVKNEDGTVTSRTVTLSIDQSVRKVCGTPFVLMFTSPSKCTRHNHASSNNVEMTLMLVMHELL